MVTIKLRVTVTDPPSFLRAWQGHHPKTAQALAVDTQMSLTMAVQDAIEPPSLSAVAGSVLHQAGDTAASVKARPWRDVEPGPW